MVKKETSDARDLRDMGSILGQEDPLEEGMATHSSILAWRIPWTEEPGGLTVHEVTKSPRRQVANHACMLPQSKQYLKFSDLTD